MVVRGWGATRYRTCEKSRGLLGQGLSAFRFALVLAVLLGGVGCSGRGCSGDPLNASATLPAHVELDLIAAGARCEAVSQSDYGGREVRVHRQCWAQPADVDALVAVVQSAVAHALPMRVRGRGHSTNAATLAFPGEVLLDTRGLRRVCRVAPERIAVGAGAGMTALQAALDAVGGAVPVINGGGPGPSVGGFVSAGGFGPGSETHGGFWQTVTRVALVDGTGRYVEFSRDDEVFGYLFGSVGQLGVIAEVEIVLLVKDEGRMASHFGVGACMVVEEELLPLDRPDDSDARLYWWTLFVPALEAQVAAEELRRIASEGVGERFAIVETFSMPLPDRGAFAPLVVPAAGDMVAVGMLGRSAGVEGDTSYREDVARMEARFSAWVERRGGRRYLPAELPRGAAIYRANWGEAVWERFREVKADLDPQGLFGRGTVF